MRQGPVQTPGRTEHRGVGGPCPGAQGLKGWVGMRRVKPSDALRCARPAPLRKGGSDFGPRRRCSIGPDSPFQKGSVLTCHRPYSCALSRLPPETRGERPNGVFSERPRPIRRTWLTLLGSVTD